MIRTVTPNPALDLTYRLERLRIGEVHRAQDVTETPGGKGINVARVLASLGHEVHCCGFLGGSTGEHLEHLLSRTPVHQDWTLVAGETRRTVTVVDEAGATLINEPGPPVSRRDWERLTRTVQARTGAGDVVVISGSAPPGTGADDLPALVRALVEADARVIADTSGPALLDVAAAGPAVLKPNHLELQAATGIDDPVAGAQDLLARGAGAVLVSRGADGVLLVTPEGAWQARTEPIKGGNPTGAGDAAVAALAAALASGAEGAGLADHLPDVVALSAAAVLMPTAGAVDADFYARMRPSIRTEPFHAAS
ncbi:1-phosphofructokinase family hexose kinase [Ruania suaedae]|uniref:1-phosphofructokinase family hexose kinase n=1 Tax=Ruania suaedae TaxID=2897774 RepID=UPI001E3E132C|nr:1-phosphofructokinase family hexose kinase [Ruania suaedae]UFU04340.1 1-phosphofructokinase family hexose kinase [Ruania suaedae]